MEPILDVTRRLHNGHPTWPGDTPINYRLTGRIQDGGAVNVGEISFSLHSGTHVDAPWHYQDDGLRLHEIDLSVYIGPALVVDATGAERLEPRLLDGLDLNGVSKVLFKSGQPNDWTSFPARWPVVDPSLPPFLAARGITLLGTDGPSADSLDSKDLPGHKALARAGVLILESLALEGVQPGRYRLVCLPLNLRDADGAPARVILEPLGV